MEEIALARFSANLGFLWTNHPLPQAILLARTYGFDAVECHWPGNVPPEQIAAALAEAELKMIGINTRRGDVAAGEMGLAALPGRERDARAAIDDAIAYARAIGAPNIHVMAGRAEGDAARSAFIGNLAYATRLAAEHGIIILIEPLNRYDNPGYFLKTSAQAEAIIEKVAAANLKLMFDCYHIQIMEGDITRKLERLLPLIGHIQIAAVPSRQEPDHGELDYRHVIAEIDRLGYSAPIGAEYRPRGSTEGGLGWLQTLR